jgi:hypothetical protein
MKVRSVKGDKTISMSNKQLVGDLKKTYLKELNLEEVTLEKIRLFCMGKELKDDLFLYSYELNDNMVCQAMIKQ